MVDKIQVSHPLVELDGDGEARQIWKLVKEKLIVPFLELNIQYFDISVPNRDATDDEVIPQAISAVQTHHVGVKCYTRTPAAAELKSMKVAQQSQTVSGMIRNALNCTVFCEPIVVANANRCIATWKKPIIVARHGFGDRYQCQNVRVNQAGQYDVVFTPSADAMQPSVTPIFTFDQKGGVFLGMINTALSVKAFAVYCFQYALERKMSLYFSCKPNIVKKYDGLFLRAFNSAWEKEYKPKFAAAGLKYDFRMTNDMVAQAIKSEGGFIWAMKNYDGDVESAMVAQGFGSTALMKSTMRCTDGMTALAEASYNNPLNHDCPNDYLYANVLSIIGTWANGLAQLARLAKNPKLAEFATKLESTAIQMAESQCVTTMQQIRGAFVGNGNNGNGGGANGEDLAVYQSIVERYVKMVAAKMVDWMLDSN